MSEPAPLAIERCTRILLHAILDYVKLVDVLRAMGVCQLWREHAVNHPTYYGQLQLLHHDRSGASEAFLLRLSRSHGRPVSIRLDLDDSRRFLPSISSHLAHIQSLTLRQTAALSFEPVLEALCRPAEMLRHLFLSDSSCDSGRTPSTLPQDFLGRRAPVLNTLHLFQVAFPDSFPEYFGSIMSLTFGSRRRHLVDRATLVMPNPFESCPHLRELTLQDYVNLEDAAWRALHAWERMSKLTFSGHATSMWRVFDLPIAAVPPVTLMFGPRVSALDLADTLPGTLEVTFPPPQNRDDLRPLYGKPPVLYTAVMRSVSHPGSGTRKLQNNIHTRGCITAFAMPALANRIVRLELPLAFWDTFVGLPAFGPFKALEELTLALFAGMLFTNDDQLLRLSCPLLRRLTLRSPCEVDPFVNSFSDVVKFAHTCLPGAKYPLILALQGLSLTGRCGDFPETFSSCVSGCV